MLAAGIMTQANNPVSGFPLLENLLSRVGLPTLGRPRLSEGAQPYLTSGGGINPLGPPLSPQCSHRLSPPLAAPTLPNAGLPVELGRSRSSLPWPAPLLPLLPKSFAALPSVTG